MAVCKVLLRLFSYTCLLHLFFGGLMQARAESSSRPNVLLIIVDTLAVEHLEPYNPSVRNAPNISKMARSGALFERAFTTAPWTKSSIASIFTSKMPSSHGVKELNDILPNSAHTLAEILKESGYETRGVISHTLINPKSGYGQGFDSYEIVPFRGNVHNAITSDEVTDIGLNRAKSRDRSKPLFLFLHYFDPHYNYKHHPKFDRTSWYHGALKPGMDIRKLRDLIPTLSTDDVRYLKGLYEEEIAYTDSEIGRLLEHLNEAGLDKNTLIVFTADHGEEFMRHGSIGHTSTLYDELIHIPLIISQPGAVQQKVVKEPVSTLDIVPTVLELTLTKNKVEDNFEGISLASVLSKKDGKPTERTLYAEVDFHSSHIKAYKAATMQGWDKLIFDKPTKKNELYARDKDPEELKDLTTSRVDLMQKLTPLLTQFLGLQTKGESPQALTRSPEELEQLRSLGYL